MADTPILGCIYMFAGNFAISGYQLCNGQLLNISQNAALFAILGTTYGGNGQTTFALPDLRGRVPVHSGNGSAGPGVNPVQLGESAGSNAVTLTTNQMPAHTHVPTVTVKVQGFGGRSGSNSPSANVLAESSSGNVYAAGTSTPLVSMAPQATSVTASNSLTGGNLPTDVMQPYLGVNFLIATQGVFPSRN